MRLARPRWETFSSSFRMSRTWISRALKGSEGMAFMIMNDERGGGKVLFIVMNDAIFRLHGRDLLEGGSTRVPSQGLHARALGRALEGGPCGPGQEPGLLR